MKNLYQTQLKFDEGINRWTVLFFNSEGYKLTFVLGDSDILTETPPSLAEYIENTLALNYIFAAQRDAEMKKAAKERPLEAIDVVKSTS